MEAAVETTASHEATHAPVGFPDGFAHEFKLLWMSRRPLLLLVAAVGLLAIAGRPWAGGELARLLMVWPVFAVIMGPAWAFAVLHNEGPSNRHYHWSQPVSRHVHSLARVAAGLAWLWLVYGVVTVSALAFAATEGNAWQLGALSGLAWLNLFTGALLGYLVVSVLTLVSDYPMRWFFGLLFLLPLALGLLAEWLGLQTLVRTLARPVTDATWGLGAIMVNAMNADVSEVMHGVTGIGNTTHTAFDPTTWVWATLLWVGILGALVALAAAVHPDQRPRLRLPRR
jgi:MFS family permease